MAVSALTTAEPPSAPPAAEPAERRPDGPLRPGDAKPANPASTDGQPAAPERGKDAATISAEAQALASGSPTSESQEDQSDLANSAAPRGKDGEPLSDAEVKQVQELKARDAEVRRHEQAHVAAGGPYVTSGPTYSYQEGPDGRRYAVGGSVGIDTSPEDTPEATITKAQTVRRAALAPAEPSSQDRRVAAQASQMEQQARAELAAERREESQSAQQEARSSASADAEQPSPNAEPSGLSAVQVENRYGEAKPEPAFNFTA